MQRLHQLKLDLNCAAENSLQLCAADVIATDELHRLFPVL